MKLGDIELISIFENKFKIDAASVFGVVPKVIWQKMAQTDDYNRITMDINPLIIRAGNELLVIDTGFGDTMTEKQNMMFGVEAPSQWDNELDKHGISPEDITGVIFTHLHADHALGALRKGGDGNPELRFPNAKLYAQKIEWQDAINPNERTAATYHADKLRLFEDSGKLELIEGDTELFPGLSLKLLGGHTPGTQGIIIDSDGQRVIYPSDIMPNSYNIKIPYVGAVDLDPITTMDRKRWLTRKLLEDDWTIAFDHDCDMRFAKFTTDEKGKVKAINHPDMA